MPIVNVEALRFKFQDDWAVTKYDDWSFYRNRFSKFGNGVKAVDLVAIGPGRVLHLVEVKDYRQHARTKPSSLAQEIADKVFDTLAALLPAALHAIDADERAMAKASLQARSLRVVLHLEQPVKHSKRLPRAIDLADVQMKLRQLLRAVDHRAEVVEMAQMRNVGWVVTQP